MTGTARTIWLYCLLAAVPVGELAAQPNRLLPVDDWTTVYVGRLQRRGLLPGLDPASLPYSAGEVTRELTRLDRSLLTNVEKRWIDRLMQSLAPRSSGDRSEFAGLEADLGGIASRSRRQDVMRDGGGPVKAWSRIGLRLFVDAHRAVAQVGARHDLFQIRDPDALDAALRWMVRNEDSYVGLRYPNWQVYLGRYAVQWSPVGVKSTILSDNPEPFDLLQLRVGSRRLRFEAVYGVLDSVELDGTFNGRAGDRSTGPTAFGVLAGSIKRLLVANRFHWRPNASFGIGVVQTVVVSHSSRRPPATVLVPFSQALLTTELEADQRFVHSLTGLQISWQPGAAAFYAEMGLEPSREDGDGRTVMAAAGSARYLYNRHVEVELAARTVSSRSYRASHPAVHMVYLLRGIGAPYKDFWQVMAGASLYEVGMGLDLDVSPYVTLLREGERTGIAEEHPESDDVFDYGGPHTTARAGVRIRHQSHRWWWLSADLGLNRIWWQDGGSSDRVETRPAVLIRIASRLPFTYRGPAAR